MTEINLRRMAHSAGRKSCRLATRTAAGLPCDHDGSLRRLRQDGSRRACPALTTKCTSISNGRFGHPFQDRPISVREAACIQTFPRDFTSTEGSSPPRGRSATRSPCLWRGVSAKHSFCIAQNIDSKRTPADSDRGVADGPFRTRARTVDMLGRQQIAGIPTAISELFKNAHDAYAD